LLNDVPEPDLEDIAIVMTKHVAKCFDLLPRLSGQQVGGLLTELRHCFADPLQAALDCIGDERILLKCGSVHTLGVTGYGSSILDDVE